MLKLSVCQSWFHNETFLHHIIIYFEIDIFLLGTIFVYNFVNSTFLKNNMRFFKLIITINSIFFVSFVLSLKKWENSVDAKAFPSVENQWQFTFKPNT